MTPEAPPSRAALEQAEQMAAYLAQAPPLGQLSLDVGQECLEHLVA